eukprot:CAMPEP_0194166696 /NCGR_PEP_ID=MMETSP0154-20130528/2230_1 /TAXON_ID=1049557 /ORGANISM="Thalassiothrix antarctica, Strain L6-D1" /LENGTH=549 /DNA_ID=CAMNT_0038877433 /DNA_START=215 /DNA_END=1864 /DNA_ORIENTATION=-
MIVGKAQDEEVLKINIEEELKVLPARNGKVITPTLTENFKVLDEIDRRERKNVLKVLTIVEDMCWVEDQTIVRSIFAGLGGPTAILRTLKTVKAQSLKGMDDGTTLSIASIVSTIIDMCCESNQFVFRRILEDLGGPVAIVRTMKAIGAMTLRMSKSRDKNTDEKQKKESEKFDHSGKVEESSKDVRNNDEEVLSVIWLICEELSYVELALTCQPVIVDLGKPTLTKPHTIETDDHSVVSLLRDELSYEGLDGDQKCKMVEFQKNRNRMIEEPEEKRKPTFVDTDDLSFVSLLCMELHLDDIKEDDSDLSFVSLIRQELKQTDVRTKESNWEKEKQANNYSVEDDDDLSIVSLIRDEISWKNFENIEVRPTNMQRKSRSKRLDERDENDEKGKSNQVTSNNLQDDDDDDDDDLSIVSLIREELSWSKLETKKPEKKSKKYVKDPTTSLLRADRDDSLKKMLGQDLYGQVENMERIAKARSKMKSTNIKKQGDRQRANKRPVAPGISSKEDEGFSLGALLVEELGLSVRGAYKHHGKRPTQCNDSLFSTE